MTIPRALKGVRGAVFDTMVLFYLLEDHPTYAPVCEALFRFAEDGGLSGVITPITLAEIVVKPLCAGRPELADRYQNAIKNLPNIALGELSWKTGVMAGALRAKYGLALPDLFQAACAMEHGGVLITNDKALTRIEEIRVVLLNDLM
jgi:predicted nucleic acid-binding protein